MQLNDNLIAWAKGSSRTPRHYKLKIDYILEHNLKHLNEDNMFQILAYPDLDADRALKILVSEYGKTWVNNLNAIVAEYPGGTVIDIRGCQ